MDATAASRPQPGASPGSSGRVAAWLVLSGMGGTGLVYNIWHATHAGHLALGLALLYGVAPVAAAMGLSHIVGAYRGGWLMQAITVCVMLGAMTLSVGATAAVIGPVAPGVLRYVFPAVMDAAALVGLRVILTPRPADGSAPPAAQVAPPPRAGAPEPGSGPATVAGAGGATTATAGGGSGPATGPARPAVSGGAGEGHDDVAAAGRGPGGGATGMAGAGREGRVLPFAPHPGNGGGTAGRRGETRRVMRAHWDSETAAGRIPNGADLNRAAGKEPDYSLGKRYAQQWRQEIAAEMREGTPAESREEIPAETPGERTGEWRADAAAGVFAGERAR